MKNPKYNLPMSVYVVFIVSILSNAVVTFLMLTIFNK